MPVPTHGLRSARVGLSARSCRPRTPAPASQGTDRAVGLVGRDHPQGGGHRLAVPGLGVTGAGDRAPVQLRADRVPGLEGHGRRGGIAQADLPGGQRGAVRRRPARARRSRGPCRASRRCRSARAWRTAGPLRGCPARGSPSGPRCGSDPAGGRAAGVAAGAAGRGRRGVGGSPWRSSRVPEPVGDRRSSLRRTPRCERTTRRPRPRGPTPGRSSRALSTATRTAAVRTDARVMTSR